MFFLCIFFQFFYFHFLTLNCFKLFLICCLISLSQLFMFVVVVLYCVQLLSEEFFISIFSDFFMSNIDPK